MISYTAKRSLIDGHAINTLYTLDIEVMQADPDVRDISTAERSAGGAMEVCFERQDVYWTIRLAPVNGPKVEQLIEFLDSIESGETFRVWLRDTDAAPLVLKMEGDAGSLDAFMRCGARDLDYFTAQFTALQAVPYDTTSGGGGGGGGGFSGGDGVPVDIFDPGFGGEGGLSPGLASGLTFTVSMAFDEGLSWWIGNDLSPESRYYDNDPEQGIAIQTSDTVVPAGTVLSGDGSTWEVTLKANEFTGNSEENLSFWEYFRAIRVTTPSFIQVELSEEELLAYYVAGVGDEAVQLVFQVSPGIDMVPGIHTIEFLPR